MAFVNTVSAFSRKNKRELSFSGPAVEKHRKPVDTPCLFRYDRGNTTDTKEAIMNHFKVNEDMFAKRNPYAAENVFLKTETKNGPLPSYKDIAHRLPAPYWDGHEDYIRCYNRTWEIAFGNLRQAKASSGFVSDFIDTAFNGYLFMWDSSFIVMFGKYANHIFDFQKTLDNFYSNQHRDGFICREICEDEAGGQFTRDDPASTGPNILPWAEWEYYTTTKNKERLAKVFPPLMAYHEWLRLNRSWPSGGYWSCGLACGMDNQPRIEPGYDDQVSHSFMTWIDACSQQLISADVLVKMAAVLGRDSEVEGLRKEREFLFKLINESMWDEETAFYYDTYRDGRTSGVKTVGAYWTMLAGIVPEERIDRFVSHLDNEKEFKRPVRIPTLSADHPDYVEDGHYWRGGVWAPTNYMVMKGLDKYGYQKLAHEIALNYVGNVVDLYVSDGTIYENYAPEFKGHGNPCKTEFVGWTGLAPISILFEYVFGIKPSAAEKKITWHVNLTEAHGIKQYPLGDTLVDLECAARESADEKPRITVRSTEKVTVEVIWNGDREIIESEA